MLAIVFETIHLDTMPRISIVGGLQFQIQTLR